MGKMRYLTGEPLKADPSLLGQPLASPARRFLAIAVDYVILFLPSLAVALGVAIFLLWLSDPVALRGLWAMIFGKSGGEAVTRAAYRDLAPLLVKLESPGLPPAAAQAVEEGDLDRAAGILSEYNLNIVFNMDEESEIHISGKTVYLRLDRIIPRFGRTVAMWGIAAIYFTLLTRSRRGATLGKRLLGIRVVSLSGERLSLLESLERFAGYLEIPGTLGFVLINLWHDPNRRLPHDRLANTAVLRLVKPEVSRKEDRAGAAKAGTGEPAGAEGAETRTPEDERPPGAVEDACRTT